MTQYRFATLMLQSSATLLESFKVILKFCLASCRLSIDPHTTSNKEIFVYGSGKDQPTAGKIYQKTLDCASSYLAFRDLPQFFKEYQTKGRALDYGCGIGISSFFLTNCDFTVTGVDTNPSMLEVAKIAIPDMDLHLVHKNRPIPVKPESYDLVFSSFVLFELENKDDIRYYLTQAKNALKPGGYLIILTGSEWMHNPKYRWLYYEANFPENYNLASGKKARVHLTDANIIFEDFYWTTKDYHALFKEVGFEVIKTHFPLGQPNEPFEWQDELNRSPFVIFVLKKPIPH